MFNCKYLDIASKIRLRIFKLGNNECNYDTKLLDNTIYDDNQFLKYVFLANVWKSPKKGVFLSLNPKIRFEKLLEMKIMLLSDSVIMHYFGWDNFQNFWFFGTFLW